MNASEPGDGDAWKGLPRFLYPDEQQQLLLSIALGSTRDPTAVFDLWCQRIDLDGDIEPASYRLLPLVYHRLRESGSRHREMARLRGIYQHSWCETQLNLRGAEAAIGTLNRAGIPVMVSKGLALVARHYASPALRPMSDCDLYIPRAEIEAACSALGEAGWRVTDPRINVGMRDMVVLYPAIVLWHDQWRELDLHWSLMSGLTMPRIINQFWTRASPHQFGASRALVPAPDDLLFHVIAHGMSSNILPPMRWIVDAATIVARHGDTIDWPALRQFARSNWAGSRLARGLALVRSLCDVPIPDDMMVDQPHLLEQLERRVILNNPGGTPPAYYPLVTRAIMVAKLLSDDDRRHLPRLTRAFFHRQLRRVLA
jgi:hypothetical protein